MFSRKKEVKIFGEIDIFRKKNHETTRFHKKNNEIFRFLKKMTSFFRKNTSFWAVFGE